MIAVQRLLHRSFVHRAANRQKGGHIGDADLDRPRAVIVLFDKETVVAAFRVT